ncbi:hypothetical protein MRB53_040125 [Persea americana]|nr:hypothetical protein MRB53_040125 [Persea americana]
MYGFRGAQRRSRCTVMRLVTAARNGHASDSGKGYGYAFLAQNWDWNPAQAENIICLHFTQPRKPKICFCHRSRDYSGVEQARMRVRSEGGRECVPHYGPDRNGGKCWFREYVSRYGSGAVEGFRLLGLQGQGVGLWSQGAHGEEWEDGYGGTVVQHVLKDQSAGACSIVGPGRRRV